MKVCFILPIGRTLGGSNIWSARMCGHLQRAGVATGLLVHANPGWHPDGDLPIPPGTSQVLCPGPPVTRAGAADVEAYARCYASMLPAVVVPNYSDAAYAACALLSRERPDDILILGVAHGNNDAYFDTLCYYESIIGAYIAVSEEIAAALRERLPHRAKDIHARACPVDVPEKLDRVPREAAMPLRITYAGRLTNHEKKVSRLVPLMMELGRLGVDYAFRIIGEGGYRATLEAEIRQLPEANRRRVRLEGVLPPDRLPGVWRESDACVLVSDSEGTSVSMLEAMAGGCVPVVTRVSGTAAVIQEGISGFTVAVGDLSAQARHLQQLHRDPALCWKMGRTAHAKALRDHSYPGYVPWFTELVQSMIVHRPPSSWPDTRPLLRAQGRGDRWAQRLVVNLKAWWKNR